MFDANNALFATTDPILVVVEGGNWEAAALTDTPTLRDAYLFGHLSGMGGVNESVESGRYHFNIENVGGLLIASLNPAP
jgi:hypothetical protein